MTLLCYGFGVVLAILNMYLAGRSGYLATEEVKARMERTWAQGDDLKDLFDPIEKGHWVGIAGQIAGWMSAILAITATVLLGIGIA